MGQLPDLPEARRRLELALETLFHHRWVLGFLRGGCLQPIVSSEISPRFMQRHPLMPLSRKALYERRPMVVNAVVAEVVSGNDYDWELDWPALLYAPVAAVGQRPVGLLILGSRDDHWYSEEDVAYAHTLGVTLAPMVAALRRPLCGLSESELVVAQLLSHGFSPQEIARAMKADERKVRLHVEKVTRRLRLLRPDELALPPVNARRMSW